MAAPAASRHSQRGEGSHRSPSIQPQRGRCHLHETLDGRGGACSCLALRHRAATGDLAIDASGRLVATALSRSNSAPLSSDVPATFSRSSPSASARDRWRLMSRFVSPETAAVSAANCWCCCLAIEDCGGTICPTATPSGCSATRICFQLPAAPGRPRKPFSPEAASRTSGGSDLIEQVGMPIQQLE